MQYPVLTSVLVVDDDPDFLELLCAQLGRIPGVEVNAAGDPDEAVRYLRENSYDLVVSDWAIQARTGEDVLERADPYLDDRADKVPVIFISGSEKVAKVQRLRHFKHFEPVSFLLKRCGPYLISLLAEQILARTWSAKELEPCSAH